MGYYTTESKIPQNFRVSIWTEKTTLEDDIGQKVLAKSLIHVEISRCIDVIIFLENIFYEEVIMKHAADYVVWRGRAFYVDYMAEMPGIISANADQLAKAIINEQFDMEYIAKIA